ncbi:MAG: T9SS type A sorting domain-containing protein [Bacteroidota bacterium]
MKIDFSRNLSFSMVRKRNAKLIAFFMFMGMMLSFLPTNAKACSTFFLRNGNHIVCGRNFDYSYKNYLIFVNKRNVTKTALQYEGELVETPAVWTSKYGSVTFNMFGAEVPADGMNEAGLVISTLILEQSEYSVIPNKPSISIDQWIQYMLDNFATVEEVIDGCSQINIRYNPGDYWRLHILVTDSNGTNATIEFLESELVVHTKETLEKKAITNSTYESSIAYYQAGEIVGNPLSSLNRYYKVAEMLDNYNNENPVDYAYQIMDYVAQAFTQRRIVYDISNRRVYLWSSDNNNIRYFDFSSFDFSCEKSVMIYQENIADTDDISGQFVPYTQQINVDFIEDGWQFLNKSYTEEELTDFSLYPESFDCFFIDAGEDAVICDNSFDLYANEAFLYSGRWSVMAGSGVLDNPTVYNTTVRNLSSGENILRWTLSNELNSYHDEIAINNNKTIAHAGSDQEICVDYFQLNANVTPKTASGFWTVVTGQGIITNLTAYNSIVTEIGSGENEFQWTIVNGNCVNSDIIKLTNNFVLAVAGEDQLVYTDSAFLSANVPNNGEGEWIILEGDGIIENNLNNETLVFGFSAGINKFNWIITNGNCSDQDELVVTYDKKTAISQIIDNKKIPKVYPNPANQFLNVKLSLFENKHVNISIFSISGRVVYDKDLRYVYESDIEKIDISSLPNGLYILSVNTRNTTYKQKFIKVSD